MDYFVYNDSKDVRALVLGDSIQTASVNKTSVFYTLHLKAMTSYEKEGI